MSATHRIPSTLLLIAAAVSLAGLTGCTGVPSPAQVEEPVYTGEAARSRYMNDVPSSSRTVLRKDYTVGARRTASVGERMLSVENYTATDQVASAVVLADFVQPCASGSEVAPCTDGALAYVAARRGDRLPVGGAYRENRKIYYQVEFGAEDYGMLYVAADARGRVRASEYLTASTGDPVDNTTGLGQKLRGVKYDAPLPSDRALFRFEVDERIDPLAPDFQHYALTYRGTTYDHRGMVYHILYTEYRREKSAEPLFEQSLAFVGDTTTIDVLGFRLRVHDVNDRQIVYTVQRD